MMDIVDKTLHEWRSTSFEYGQRDCMLSIGRYLAQTGHKDVTGQFIGQYDTHDGALEQMSAHGGIEGLMALAGAVIKDDEPERGDVIEVLYEDEHGTSGIGGLCTGNGVALRLERGVIEIRLRFVNYREVWKGVADGRN